MTGGDDEGGRPAPGPPNEAANEAATEAAAHAGSGPGPGWSLRRRRQALLDLPDLDGFERCRRGADLADEWLGVLLGAAAGGDLAGLALFAVGGLGRRELLPGSDLDLLLVHDKRKNAARVAEAVWYPIWDDDLGLDHSLRTPKEILVAADADLRVALGLLDARLVAGDAALGASVLARIDKLWRARRERWLAALIPAVEERHRRFGDVAFLLEPDLKEGRGGLRDVHTLRAAATMTPVLETTLDQADLHQAGRVLTSVLVALQGGGGSRVPAKVSSRLLLQDQDAVAATLGMADADALMAEVAAAGRAVAWAADDGWRRVGSWLRGPSGRRAGRDRPVGPGLVLRDDEVVVLGTTDVASDPSLALRAADASVDHGVPIARASLARLAAEVPAPPDPWPDEVRHALVRLLGTGPGGVTAMETLDQCGLLVRLLPEWAEVRNRPQRNAYHRFTVDRHLLETAAGASALVRRVGRPDLLLVGALLHDIGKGKGGDHSEVGAAIAARLAARMGFAAPDVATIELLARHHLLLPDVATRRDLDDPATVPAVARAVADTSALELLAALTEADSLATGPAAWGAWKAGLVAQLVERTAAALGGEEREPGPAAPTPAQQRLLDAGSLAVVAEGSEVSVGAPDTPGLLSVVAGVLALRGVDVRAAAVRAAPRNMALLTFAVAPAFDVLPDWDRVRDDIGAALEGRLPLAARLAEREAEHRRWTPHRQASLPEVEVQPHNDASSGATVIEVRAPDSLGLLSRAAAALARAGLDIHSARAVTLGGEVVDAFYVRDGSGAKLSDEAAGTVAAAVAEALRAG